MQGQSSQVELKAQEAVGSVRLCDDKAVDADERYLEQAKLEIPLLSNEEAEKHDEHSWDKRSVKPRKLRHARKLHF